VYDCVYGDTMNFFNFLSTVLFISAAVAVSIRDSHVLHERRLITPAPWVKRSQAPRDVVLPVRIAIELRNIERGHEYLMDISDPTSLNFSKHWTLKKVHDVFVPAQETVQAVREWLSLSGIATHRHTITVGRGQILFKASVDEIESLLGTQYDIWEHDETGALSIACDEYYLP
jgi:tripeptidyl-peptidase-1